MLSLTSPLKLSFLLLIAALGACSTEVQTNPARTAREQLLISSAIDRAAAKLALAIPADNKAFLDTSNVEGTDSKYAVASIRSHLLQRGINMIDDRKQADVIIEARAGALSTDRSTYMIGIPGFNVPIPLTSGSLPFPEIALYGKEEQNGVAKLAVTGYSTKDGKIVATQEPQHGFSHNAKKTILIFFTYAEKDYLPPGIEEGQDEPNEPGASGGLGINGNGYMSTQGMAAGTGSAPTSDSGNLPFHLPGL